MGVALPGVLFDGLLLFRRPGTLLLAGVGLVTGVEGFIFDGVLFTGVVLPGVLLFTGAGVDGLFIRPGTTG